MPFFYWQSNGKAKKFSKRLDALGKFVILVSFAFVSAEPTADQLQ